MITVAFGVWSTCIISTSVSYFSFTCNTCMVGHSLIVNALDCYHKPAKISTSCDKGYLLKSLPFLILTMGKVMLKERGRGG